MSLPPIFVPLEAKMKGRQMDKDIQINIIGTSVSLMTFNSKATLHVKLPQVSANKPQTLEFLTKELEKIRFSGGATQKLAEALVMAGAQVFPENAKSARETKKVRFSKFSLGYLPLGPYIFKLPFGSILPDVIYHSDPFFPI